MKFNYDNNKLIGSFKGNEKELLQHLQNILNEDELGVLDESKLLITYFKYELDEQRTAELKVGSVLSDVFMNEDIIKTMAVQHNIATDDEVIDWIDINNQTVTFNKVDFGALIKAGSQKVKETYFKYRKLKDELL